MHKRGGAAVGVLLSAVLLSGCKGTIPTTSGKVMLPETFDMQTRVNYMGCTYEGTFSRSMAGDLHFDIQHPPGMAGSCLMLVDGELTAEYEGLHFTVAGGAQPDGAVMEILKTTLGDVNGTEFKRPEGNGPFQLTLQNAAEEIRFVVARERSNENFIPQRITIEKLRFEAFFTPPLS